MERDRYIHGENYHNLDAPNVIVPKLIELFNPGSVVDFGCGIGTFLYVFKQQGVSRVLGLDGIWANKDLIDKYLDEDEFRETDLEAPVQLKEKFDLVISLEVAEHLKGSSADTFVESLCSAGNVIVFSAALPRQGGQNHINEQWIPYWESRFGAHGFKMHDILRPLFWEEKEVFWWYKQNMVVFAREGETILPEMERNQIRNLIHPELFNLKLDYWQQEMKDVMAAKRSPGLYFKLFMQSFLGAGVYSKIKSLFGR